MVTENPLPHVDTEELRKRYEREHPMAMSVLRLGGVYPGEAEEL